MEEIMKNKKANGRFISHINVYFSSTKFQPHHMKQRNTLQASEPHCSKLPSSSLSSTFTMGPIRKLKKRNVGEVEIIDVDHDDDQQLMKNVLDSESPLMMQQPKLEPLDWWVDFSKRISGPLTETKKFESIFKMSRKTFNFICSLVKDNLTARSSNFSNSLGKHLSPKDQVAVALRRLSSGDSLSAVGDSFGINQSSVSQITWRFVEAMEEKGIRHLSWPSTESKMDNIKTEFEKLGGLPNCCGVIDTTHILMNLPTVDSSNDVWIDREKNYSMILQVVVDPKMRFVDVNVGWPGSLSDDHVLKSSGLCKLSEEEKRLYGKKLELPQGGGELREYIVGDSAFSLLPWLLTPYKIKPLSNHQLEFNKRHYATRRVGQMALARLKEMWKVIHGVMWMPDKNRLPRIVFVCCLLHNIMIDMEDEMLDELPLSYYHDSDYRQQSCESVDNTASLIRDKLSLYLSGNLPP